MYKADQPIPSFLPSFLSFIHLPSLLTQSADPDLSNCFVLLPLSSRYPSPTTTTASTRPLYPGLDIHHHSIFRPSLIKRWGTISNH
ncbi:hypothetical protein ASPFODRAFT_47623 [Aspergillus luchuensis CBS 106.47]|uniref:Uncharacterized protein n=1 Tax=Aspergillus luchuensis (strain CBS 106.47) TaxID=1137211 RepID=A0A1M3TE81_ASPLC|nr:hypothetical protein ASPFODRAFT_47623 [Aspergillus luchuensis CBS 106.47]